MSSGSTARATPPRSKDRILLIEPDRSRGVALREILREGDTIELEIVDGVRGALRSLAERIPDLVLTSMFLPPADGALLTARLNKVRAAGHVQVIALPYFIDADNGPRTERSPATVLSFLRGRSALVRPRCDVRTLREQIKQYLSQAKALRRELDTQTRDSRRARTEVSAPPQRSSEMGLVPVSAIRPAVAVAASVPYGPPVPRASVPGLPSDRRRAHRRRACDVAWLWTVKLPGVSHVSIVDISSAGVLLETTSRLVDGSTVDLQLLGQDTNVSMPARMVRTHVAAVDGMGVRYHAAVAFARDLDLVGLQKPSTAPLGPKALGDVLIRVLSEIDRHTDRSAICRRFEQEVRQLLRVRDIQIRQTPLIAERGVESVYFTVPTGTGAPPILQATFDADYRPTATEFRLLKAAAGLAAVVLEFAPLGQPATDD